MLLILLIGRYGKPDQLSVRGSRIHHRIIVRPDKGKFCALCDIRCSDDVAGYIVDMLVDGIVIELKAVSTLLNVHIAQTINYLVAMKIDYGMLINFGSHKFETRKLARPHTPASPVLCG